MDKVPTGSEGASGTVGDEEETVRGECNDNAHSDTRKTKGEKLHEEGASGSVKGCRRPSADSK